MEISDKMAADRVAGLVPVKSTAEEDKTDFQREMDVIRKKGFGNYVEDIHKKKQEELREKILRAMGLTEEQLAELPPERRRNIEKMISEEIQKQMAAETSQDNGEGAKWAGTNEPGDISQQALALRTGMGGAALAMQAVMDHRDIEAPSPTKSKDVE